MSSPAYKPYDVTAKLAELTLDEKISLLAGDVRPACRKTYLRRVYSRCRRVYGTSTRFPTKVSRESGRAMVQMESEACVFSTAYLHPAFRAGPVYPGLSISTCWSWSDNVSARNAGRRVSICC